MSIPGLNPSSPPVQVPAPNPPQNPPPRPGSPTLRNRPTQHDRQAEEDTASGSGLKRGRSAEADEGGMDIETSSEPAFKRRRGESAPATPELLHRLIEAADEDGMRALIQQAPQLLNECDPQSIFKGLTPLCYAAERGLEAMVRCLVDCNASVHHLSLSSMTPLMVACRRGHLSVAQALHQHGANLDATDANGDNCLHYTANHGRDAVAAWLLAQHMSVNEPNQHGWTALMCACAMGHLSFAQMLRQHRASLDAKDRNGANCLHWAAQNGCDAVVAWLLAQNIYVDEPNKHGWTALMCACRSGHLSVAQMLRQNDASLDAKDIKGKNCLHWAANHGRDAVVAWLLREGMGVDAPTQGGITALMCACAMGHLSVAKVLHQHRANLAAKDDHGRNCLHHAAAFGRTEIVAWLLAQNMSVDEPTPIGVTALIAACGRGHLSVAQMLRQNGANLDDKDIKGNNCLHYTANQGHEAVVAWLLREGMGVDAPTPDGITALMCALRSGHLSVAQILWQHGANLSATDTLGVSALHVGVQQGHITVVTWLLDKNVPVDDAVKMETPLSMAFNKLNWTMMALLIERGAKLDRLNRHDKHIGDEIFTQAMKHDRYDVLLQLIRRNWPFPKDWDALSTRNSSDNSSGDVDVAAMRNRFALIHDLDRVFGRMVAPLGAATEDDFIEPAWLLPEKRSDRQSFIEIYLNHFLAADEEISGQSISHLEISSHPLFSYVIHDQLTRHPRNFTKLLHALAGTGRVMPASHSQKVSLFKLQAIQRAWQSNRPFQDKHLSPATLSIIDNVLKRQLETLLLATEEYFLKDLSKFPETLERLCKKYIRFGGDFDAAGFTKALAKKGIYAVNADRLTELVNKVWEEIRLKPMDLPPVTTIGQVYSLSQPQVMARLLPQINKAVLEGPEEWILPGFAKGMATLQQEDMDIYADQIFGQWRQMWAALGVVLPEVVMSQQS